jgi:hypothetical protein
VSPFEKDQLENHSLSLKGEDVDDISNYLDTNNNINISLADSFRANNSAFSLNFTTEFRVGFKEPLSETWAIDRLINEADIRERIYFPSVIEGPEYL